MFDFAKTPCRFSVLNSMGLEDKYPAKIGSSLVSMSNQ